VLIKVASLFSGIGGFEKGFLQADPNTEFVFSSEIDKYARQIYTKNYGVEPHGDIKKINAADVPEHDILCGGFPCQDVSIAGKRAGLCGERSGLFFEIVRILREKQPKLVLLENVTGLLSSNRGWDFARVLIELEDVGYTCEWQILNSADYGVAQNRKRVYIIGYLGGFGGGKILPITTNDRSVDEVQKPATNCLTSRYERAQTTGSYIIENQFDAQKIPKVAKCLTGGGHSGGLHSDMTGIAVHSSLPRSSKSGKGGTGHLQRNDGITYCIDAANNVAVEVNQRIRRLTPVECERLQGFPDNWTAEGIDSKGNIVKISDTQRYKCLGNAVTTTVTQFIFENIICKCYI